MCLYDSLYTGRSWHCMQNGTKSSHTAALTPFGLFDSKSMISAPVAAANWRVIVGTGGKLNGDCSAWPLLAAEMRVRRGGPEQFGDVQWLDTEPILIIVRCSPSIFLIYLSTVSVAEKKHNKHSLARTTWKRSLLNVCLVKDIYDI